MSEETTVFRGELRNLEPLFSPEEHRRLQDGEPVTEVLRDIPFPRRQHIELILGERLRR